MVRGRQRGALDLQGEQQTVQAQQVVFASAGVVCCCSLEIDLLGLLRQGDSNYFAATTLPPLNNQHTMAIWRFSPLFLAVLLAATGHSDAGRGK